MNFRWNFLPNSSSDYWWLSDFNINFWIKWRKCVALISSPGRCQQSFLMMKVNQSWCESSNFEKQHIFQEKTRRIDIPAFHTEDDSKNIDDKNSFLNILCGSGEDRIMFRFEPFIKCCDFCWNPPLKKTNIVR